jgi:hypothetical protein
MTTPSVTDLDRLANAVYGNSSLVPAGYTLIQGTTTLNNVTIKSTRRRTEPLFLFSKVLMLTVRQIFELTRISWTANCLSKDRQRLRRLSSNKSSIRMPLAASKSLLRASRSVATRECMRQTSKTILTLAQLFSMRQR